MASTTDCSGGDDDGGVARVMGGGGSTGLVAIKMIARIPLISVTATRASGATPASVAEVKTISRAIMIRIMVQKFRTGMSRRGFDRD